MDHSNINLNIAAMWPTSHTSISHSDLNNDFIYPIGISTSEEVSPYSMLTIGASLLAGLSVYAIGKYAFPSSRQTVENTDTVTAESGKKIHCSSVDDAVEKVTNYYLETCSPGFEKGRDAFQTELAGSIENYVNSKNMSLPPKDFGYKFNSSKDSVKNALFVVFVISALAASILSLPITAGAATFGLLAGMITTIAIAVITAITIIAHDSIHLKSNYQDKVNEKQRKENLALGTLEQNLEAGYNTVKENLHLELEIFKDKEICVIPETLNKPSDNEMKLRFYNGLNNYSDKLKKPAITVFSDHDFTEILEADQNLINWTKYAKTLVKRHFS